MKRVILEFDLQGDEGVYEREELLRCIKSLDFVLALNEIVQRIFSSDDEKMIQFVDETLEKYDIHLDEVLS